jgi:hypothetical protein
MRKLSGIALGALLAVGIAGTASAATLTYTGTLIFGLATLPSGTGAGSGTIQAVTVTGHLSNLTFVGGEVGPISTSLPVTSSATVRSVRLTGIQNVDGTITGISGGPPLGSGEMGFQGMAKICLVLGNCNLVNVPVPLSPTIGGAGMGIGGTQLLTASVHTPGTYTTPPAVKLTMQHNPWTIGVPSMTVHSPDSAVTSPAFPSGFAHGPASATTTAQASGVVQLVTATKVFTSLTGAFPELPVFSILTLHFVPEPSTPLLLGAVGVTLVILGRRRSGK